MIKVAETSLPYITDMGPLRKKINMLVKFVHFWICL